MWWLPLLLVPALLAGCSAGEARQRAAPAPIVNEEHGFTAELPAGWALAQRSLTPTLVNPEEILSAGTAPAARRPEGRCPHMPVAALEGMGPADAFVTVQERYGEPQFPTRPQRFELPPPEDTDAGFCAANGRRLEIHWFGFRDARRGFHVLVAFGRDAPPERRAEALALLDSLRFEPGPAGVDLDPDEVVPFRDHDIAWLMPAPRWRWYRRSMTTLARERLAFGTFPLRHAPPVRGCTPPPIPDDGAFVLVFESGAACPGESFSLRRQGLVAHVFLGARAGGALEREARSIVASIRVG